jgi:CHAT domain-containing protein
MKHLVVLLTALAICEAALAQKMSRVPDSFLSDVNSLAGISRIGSTLLASDPDKLKWGEYCKQSQALARRGEFREAIRSASKALYLGENKDGNYGAAVIFSSNDIATAYSYAGDHPTALIWADRTLATIGKGFENWARSDILLITANVRRIRALAYSNAGRHQDAAAELIKASDSLSPGSEALRSELAIALASVYTKAGQYPKAADVLAGVLAQNDSGLALPANRAAGDLALARKDADAAKGYYTKALAIAHTSKDTYQAVMARLGMARTARLAGDKVAASSELSQALQSLEKLREAFSSTEMRTALYGNLQNVFDEAVDFFALNDQMEEAFYASESSRARAMLDLQRKVRFNAETRVPAIKPQTAVQIQKRLGPLQTMVVYHQLQDKLLAWTLTNSSFHGLALGVGSEQLRNDVAKLRTGIEREDSATKTLSQTLYKSLLEPLHVSAGSELIFVPHKSLHLLPFQALHDGSHWLIEKAPVTTAMSASLFEMSSNSDTPPRLAALGNPDLGKAEWALPGSEAEVKAIQTMYTEAKVYIAKEASKARLEEIAPGAHVVHVAAHAVIDEIDPMYSVIKLAISPLRGVGPSPDMEAREFAALNLQSTRLVSLSACNSGYGKVSQGDEFMGFKRAVLTAGAKSALVSLWPVEDDATRLLMTEFHRHWKDESKARAMQDAQIKVLTDPKFSNPFYWAAFTLIGDPS